MTESWAQHVVVYENGDREQVVYATAYGDEERKQQIMNCAKRYGRQANVRSVLAEHYPPQAA